MEAPNFSRTLEPLTVKEHEPATFRVFYSGCPRPEVTWMRYTFPIEDSDAHQIHTTGRSNWILQRKWKYYICCLRDVTLKLERDLSYSI